MDQFSSFSDTVTGPARQAFVIAPHAVNEIAPLPKAVRFGTGGTVTYRAVDSAADITETVVAGEVLQVRMLHIRVAGTTASGIVGYA